MQNRRLLLLSNSKNANQGYLEHAEGYLKEFLGTAVRGVLFIPYAGVRVTWQDYAANVRKHFQQMGYELYAIHETGNAEAAVQTAEAIAIGGGNTFHLLRALYENKLLEAIRARVAQGVPYIGWSAGSNVACPTIKTTNDMPIVEPQSFQALGLVPFQLNPHYLDTHPQGHQGETREERLLEFVAANPEVCAVGLREGSLLQIEGAAIKLLGEKTARVFRNGQEIREYGAADSLAFLLARDAF
jgi:dipeptidase E